MKFRAGKIDDATTLALILDAAGRRIPAYFWSLYAAEGQSFLSLGVRISVLMMRGNHFIKTGK